MDNFFFSERTYAFNCYLNYVHNLVSNVGATCFTSN